MEYIFLEAIARHRKVNKVVENSQRGFTKDKSYLTNLITFCNETAGSVDKARTDKQ